MNFLIRCFVIAALCSSAPVQSVSVSVGDKSIYFYQCTENQYIFCEPGSEHVAGEIADSLKFLKGIVQERQLLFIDEPKFFTYQVIGNFVKNTGATSYIKAAVIGHSVHISPAIYSSHEFGNDHDVFKKIITHELSHLNLLQNYGDQTYFEIPSWFMEGLATYISGGAGAESVTAAQARNLLMEGIGFSPDKDHEFPTKSMVLKINPQIYYKQAEGFVRFIDNLDSTKLKKLLATLKNSGNFHNIFFETYQMSVFDMWNLYTYQVLKEY